MRLCLSIFLLFTLSACQANKSHDADNDVTCWIQKEMMESEKEDSVHPTLNETKIIEKTLTTSYPQMISKLDRNYIFMSTGDSILFDDGKEKDFLALLDDSDVEDMFSQTYALPEGKPEYLSDPGRSRSESLFKAMYGKNAKEVEQNLTTIEWFGQKVKFNAINGAADSLRAVAKELADHPELKPYLKSSGTFYWRPVRGAKRMSAHSYGIAFDIGVDKSNYWQWTLGSNDELKEVEYQNKIPMELVRIFQKHGFIWGGAWYHYDTMHFEFRPDLLLYAELSQAKN